MVLLILGAVALVDGGALTMGLPVLLVRQGGKKESIPDIGVSSYLRSL